MNLGEEIASRIIVVFLASTSLSFGDLLVAPRLIKLNTLNFVKHSACNL